MATNNPVERNFFNSEFGILKGMFFHLRKIAIPTVAINMRYQTNESEGIEIKAPKTPVNPQMKTMK